MAGGRPYEKGNQEWKKRLVHGRQKFFKTPQDLFDAFEKYVEHEDKRTDFNKVVIKKTVIKKKDWDDFSIDEQEELSNEAGTGVEYHQIEEFKAAPTIYGFSVFVGANHVYLTDFRNKLDLETEEGQDYNEVIQYIYDFIKNYQVQGAINGRFKENLVARLNGIKDGSDNTLKIAGKTQVEFFGSQEAPDIEINNEDETE